MSSINNTLCSLFKDRVIKVSYFETKKSEEISGLDILVNLIGSKGEI